MKPAFDGLITFINLKLKMNKGFEQDKLDGIKSTLLSIKKQNAGKELSFNEVLNILTSAEYKFENQITDFGQKSNPNDGDDVRYETVNFSNEINEYFAKNLASICETEFKGVEDATTLTFIF
jgi:hypothetical protein